ncbi:MAG: hypothetical protein GY866_14305 [Proteobacteria bacterium]|nr:hypothetical protein [Pseudomonadota bacterium]
MPAKNIRKVCFLGAGTMGCFNSLLTAVAGYEVVLYDVSEEALKLVPQRHREWGAVLMESRSMDQATVEAGFARVSLTTDPEEAARDADFLSESVFERLDIKRSIHEQFDKILPAHTIMTTNTSTLLLSEIESAVERGDRFAALHFHQPSTLVDIVAGPRTSAETIETVKEFARSIGQIYVLLKKERSGYLHNAMFVSLLASSIILKALGDQDFQDIDRAWMLNRKAAVGPFGMIDGVGLNIVLDILENAAAQAEDRKEQLGGIVGMLRSYVDRGDLGMKTGKGFYEYPEPAYTKPDFLAGKVENKEVSNALLLSVLSTALTLVIEDYAGMEDVDKSWMIPHGGEAGPFGLMDQMGLDEVLKAIEERAKLIKSMMGDQGPEDETANMTADFLRSFIDKGNLGVKTGKGFYSYPDPAYKKPGFLGQ